MKLIDDILLDQVTQRAKENIRLRMNYNLHDSLESKAQRLFNALEPGTELPVHRHIHTSETYIIIRGRMNVFFYNDDKQPTEQRELNPQKGCYGIQIPAGQWHTLEVLESGTIIFEVKDGPYVPLSSENIMTF